MPRPVERDGQRLPASYANFYVGNESVLVPTFNDPNDRVALGTLGELFSDRPVVGIHAVDLVRAGSRASNPAARLLDTGQELKVEELKGAAGQTENVLEAISLKHAQATSAAQTLQRVFKDRAAAAAQTAARAPAATRMPESCVCPIVVLVTTSLPPRSLHWHSRLSTRSMASASRNAR